MVVDALVKRNRKLSFSSSQNTLKYESENCPEVRGLKAIYKLVLLILTRGLSVLFVRFHVQFLLVEYSVVNTKPFFNSVYLSKKKYPIFTIRIYFSTVQHIHVKKMLLRYTYVETLIKYILRNTKIWEGKLTLNKKMQIVNKTIFMPIFFSTIDSHLQRNNVIPLLAVTHRTLYPNRHC